MELQTPLVGFDASSELPPRRAGGQEPEAEASQYFGAGAALDALDKLQKQLATGKVDHADSLGADIDPHTQASAFRADIKPLHLAGAILDSVQAAQGAAADSLLPIRSKEQRSRRGGILSRKMGQFRFELLKAKIDIEMGFVFPEKLPYLINLML